MSFTRRSFLTTTAGVAAGAAGAAVLTTPGQAGAAIARRSGAGSPRDTGAEPSAAELDGASGAVVYIRDAAAGAVVIMQGEHEVVVTDRSLVAAVAHATTNGRS